MDGTRVDGPEADPACLSHAQRVDALVALEAQIAALQARQLRVMAAMAADPVTPDLAGEPAAEWVREDVTCALRLSPVAASARLALADDVRRLPGMLGLLAAGEVSLRQVTILAESVRPLDDEAAAAVEAMVLARAPEQAPAAFRRSVTRAVLKVDSRNARRRHEHEKAGRRVCFTPLPDGMGQVWALLPADGLAVVKTALDALARRVPGVADGRSADQRRADALVDLCARSLVGDPSAVAGGTVGREHGRRPAVQVTVALSTLLGADDQPGDLDGYGPIPAELARRIAADPTGSWRRLVVDDLGRLVDHGRRTYRPPADLTDHVIARDRTCTFPGCSRRARACELDHALDWADGGTTCEANLGALCARHHRAKHVAGWRLRREPNGVTLWYSPTGQGYLRRPATYPVDRTRSGDRGSGDDHPSPDAGPDGPIELPPF